MSFDWPEVKMGIPPQKEVPKDVREMRQIIDRAGRDCSIINLAESSARYQGLSGEDKYVVLAYYALLELNRQWAQNIRWLSTSPVRIVFSDKP